jgi:hypothetical protein
MNSVWMKEIRHKRAWRGEDLVKDGSWLTHLTEGQIRDIDNAFRAARATGKPTIAIRKEDFPLQGEMKEMLARTVQEIVDGRGFVVLRGLPVKQYSEDDVSLIFWGLGRHMGTPLYQNPKGDILGQVKDYGRRYGDIDVRGYEGHGYLPYHTDGCDLVGLLCLRKGLAGGLSSIVSSTTVHNEILKNHPEYLGLLYNGFFYIRREEALSEKGVSEHPVPVFGHKDGLVSCRYIRNQINAGAVKRGVPLRPLEQEALDYMDETTRREDLRLDMDLQPGDMQLCNNYTILHSRTEFVDGPEPHQKRHMIRLWLKFPQKWPLGDHFPEQNGYAPAPGTKELIEV